MNDPDLPESRGRSLSKDSSSEMSGDADVVTTVTPGASRQLQPNSGLSQVKGRIKPAKKIPFWLWVLIAKSLGIKLHEKDKPIISAVLHILTFGSALGLFMTNTWVCGYSISSIHTKVDILDGTVSIMVISFFCGLGVYSHRLAYRLFVHPKFLDMLRLHSKTIFKINSALVIFMVLLSFVICLNVSTISYTYPYDTSENITLENNTNINPCQVVDIEIEVCQTYWICQMTFSVFFLVWNLLVAVVLVSVARTQTISIRRFLKQLESDARMLDSQFASKFLRSESSSNFNQYTWTDDDTIADFFSERSVEVNNVPSGASRNTLPSQNRPAEIRQRGSFSDLQLRFGRNSSVSRFEQLVDGSDGSNYEDMVEDPHIMSAQEIMHLYWRISMSVRLASVALQRWMISISLMITAWTAIRMVYWLSHTPSLYGIIMFILPLLLLPLLASSYSEVNYEGAKIIQSIMPTDDRIRMFQYLYGQPIMMTVYGHAVTYGTIGTVVVGILAAFASKIFLQEINTI